MWSEENVVEATELQQLFPVPPASMPFSWIAEWPPSCRSVSCSSSGLCRGRGLIVTEVQPPLLPTVDAPAFPGSRRGRAYRGPPTRPERHPRNLPDEVSAVEDRVVGVGMPLKSGGIAKDLCGNAVTDRRRARLPLANALIDHSGVRNPSR